MNAVVINPNQQIEFVLRYDLYAMEVDYGRNCYSCGRFRHLVKNCRNR